MSAPTHDGIRRIIIEPARSTKRGRNRMVGIDIKCQFRTKGAAEKFAAKLRDRGIEGEIVEIDDDADAVEDVDA
jgi:hypothetical protein